VVEAYNFLALNYDAHFHGKNKNTLNETESDEIFLFGFSRGAYTVRALAGLISKIGILEKSSLRDFASIYADYQKGPTYELKIPENAHKVRPEAVKIKVIGCWDTVGSLGVPDAAFLPGVVRDYANKRHAFHDAELSNCKC
jgi:uncharacterized protein (DUF2235 family)